MSELQPEVSPGSFLSGKLIPIVSLMLCFLIGSVVLMASDKPKLEGKELIDSAAERTNIFDLPSFEMRASVKIDNYGKPLDGSYLLLWNGPERWREEISLPGYSEVRVGGKGIVFLKRSTDFIPVRIDQLHSTLGYGSEAVHSSRFVQIALRSDEIVKKVRSQKVNGSEADCAEIVDRENRSREVCVDKGSGAPVRQSPFHDGEMIETGGKLYPHVLSYLEKGKTLAEVQVTEFKTTEPSSPSAFEPPQGALSTPGCMNPVPARLVKKVQPKYPGPERQSRVEGIVSMNAWVRKDGSVSDLRLISGVTTGLNNASLEAVRQWRYEPATCDSLAVDVETVLTVNYVLQ